MRNFWMVHVDGRGGAVFKHATHEKALEEAKRLAKEEGASAYVLRCEKAVEYVPPNPPEEYRITTPGGGMPDFDPIRW